MSDKAPESASGSHDDYVAHTLAAYERGDAILDAVHAFLGRFVCYPSHHAHVAHTLWIVHTHALHAVDSTPRACFLSPEPGSGKSRALEITALLVPATPVIAINVSAAYLFRRLLKGDRPPVILYDEADTIFGPLATPNEEVRGLLNAGFRRGAVTGRCVMAGKEVIAVDFPAFAPVALAGLGTLPDTILSRAIIFRMRRRGPGESIEAFRQRKHEREGFALRDRIAIWVAREWPEGTTMGDFDDMPPGVDDRDADVWECLLHIGAHAGHRWGELAKAAATFMVQDAHKGETSIGLRLLADLRPIFNGKSDLHTANILAALCAQEESPWKTIRKGQPLDANKLARLLKPYEIAPAMLGTSNQRGYSRISFEDAWNRYLAPSSSSSRPDQPASPAMPANSQAGGRIDGLQVDTDPARPAKGGETEFAGLAGRAATRKTGSPHGDAILAGLARLAGQNEGDDRQSSSDDIGTVEL